MLQDRYTQKSVDNLIIDEKHKSSYCSKNNGSDSISITSGNADNVTVDKNNADFLRCQQKKVVPPDFPQTQR